MANRKGIHIYILIFFMAIRNCINDFVIYGFRGTALTHTVYIYVRFTFMFVTTP